MLLPKSLRSVIFALFLSLTLIVTGCAQTPTTPDINRDPNPDTTSTISIPSASIPSAIQPTHAIPDTTLPGSAFNNFFPQVEEGFERVYTQEKAGFAEAKLKQEGQEIAKLAISDTISTPAALQKFADVNETIAGYPAVTIGSKQTAILVGERFQVKVISVVDQFTADDRQDWLQKFDLQGLATLP